MGSYTDNLNLYKPAAAETGWDDLVNNNFDTLDSNPTNWDLVRYVDYQNGLDTNDGRSRSASFKTIQAAYDNLNTYASANYTSVGALLQVGRIELAPGDHDVGEGFWMDGERPCEVRGFRHALNYPAPDTTSRIVTSSVTADYLCKVDNLLDVEDHPVAHGSRFYDIQFNWSPATNTALTKCIYAQGVDYLHVERCGFRTNPAVSADGCVAIYADSNGDASWHRIFNNNCGHMQFAHYVGGLSDLSQPNGGNMNRNYLHYNVVFFNGTNPMVQLNGEFHESSVSFNNLEGTAPQVELGPRPGQRGSNFDFNVFIANNGESSDDTYPFYKLLTQDAGVSGANGCVFMGGMCTAGAGNFGTWYEATAGGGLNMVIGGNYSYEGVAGYKAKIVDNSLNHNCAVINPQYGGVIPRIELVTATYTVKSGDNYIFADSTAGAFTLNLPTAVLALGKQLTFKRLNAGANDVTLNPSGSQTIDGLLTWPLTTQYEMLKVVSDGTNWMTI